MSRQADSSKLCVKHFYKSGNETDRKKFLNRCMEQVIARHLDKTAYAPHRNS